MKVKNIRLISVVLLTEAYFFYRSGFEFSENFFLIFAVIFGVFFAFGFVGGGSSFGGVGADPKFLAAKAAESLYVKPRYSGTKYNDSSLDIIFLVLAVGNLILSFIAYYLGR